MTCLEALKGEHAKSPDWQIFIKPADVQINLEAKSKPGGQNGLIWNKDETFYQIDPFMMPNHL
jgi:hypothetical protein